jgi:hypothetical protein
MISIEELTNRMINHKVVNDKAVVELSAKEVQELIEIHLAWKEYALALETSLYNTSEVLDDKELSRIKLAQDMLVSYKELQSNQRINRKFYRRIQDRKV